MIFCRPCRDWVAIPARVPSAESACHYPQRCEPFWLLYFFAACPPLEVMQKPLLTCAQWAEQTFGDVDLADCRRRRRLVKVAAALAGHPGGTLPGALPKWKDLKAAYRLLDNPSVTFEKLLRPQWRRVQSLCAAAGQYLVIEDTTLLDFTSHRSPRGIKEAVLS